MLKRTREEVLEAARRICGAKFQHRGRTQFGIDCLGLPIFGAGLIGSEHDVTNYKAEHAGEGDLRAWLLSAGFRLLDGPGEPGDLVTLHERTRPTIESHCGILTEYGWVHVNEQMGRVRETRFDEVWSRLRHAAYAFPGVM